MSALASDSSNPLALTGGLTGRWIEVGMKILESRDMLFGDGLTLELESMPSWFLVQLPGSIPHDMPRLVLRDVPILEYGGVLPSTDLR